jgi:hypothetical protein
MTLTVRFFSLPRNRNELKAVINWPAGKDRINTIIIANHPILLNRFIVKLIAPLFLANASIERPMLDKKTKPGVIYSNMSRSIIDS